MEYESISSIDDLRQFCDELSDAPVIGFDTEFVSEDRYRPQLCLIQVAAGDRLAIIDPLKMHSTAPFWDLLVQPGRTVIAHAAREESRFCYQFTNQPIAGLFDTQLAAGFSGMEFPISLGNLVNRLTGKTLAKGESRTNWRHRPLSVDQLHYALQDVTELEAMYRMQMEAVARLDRQSWLEEETGIRQQKVIEQETSENWHRVSGCAGMSPRQLEIIRHLWRWRDKRAATLDRPVRRVMRDDLMVELAKRGSADINKIRSIRGMDWRGYSAHYGDIATAIEAALEVPDEDLPRRTRRSRSVISPMLSQFLSTSMACISRQNQLAPSIVGNADDVKEVLGYELDRKEDDQVPSLLTGWRGEIIGKTFRKLLSGEAAIRVANVRQEQPLEFIELD